MLQVSILGTKCRGWYLEHRGDHYRWEQVEGKVIQTSRKVIDRGKGITYINCKVEIYTHTNGTKIAYILVGSKKVRCESGMITKAHAKVGRLRRFKLGKLIGGFSNKVLAN